MSQHIITRNSPSCIDFIFASQPNLVMKSGVHSLLYENYHHQIIDAKFSFKIYHSPPYEREICHYQKANRKNQKSDRSISMRNAFDHGTIIWTGITCKKIFYKSLLNSAWLWSRARLALNKKQKYFSLPDHQLAENQILVFGL